jgi:sigma-B regulation protein RsbU (phosphoserine phosphatase)
MASNAIMSREAGAVARAPRFLVRYILLALLFAIAVFFQIGTTRAFLHRIPADYPNFGPFFGSPALQIVDSRALAAGLHKGDILVAINGRPCTGSIVYWEETQNAVPGKPLAVTVRSTGPDASERTILLPVTPSQSWTDKSALVIPIFVLMPLFFLALAFWVVLVRPSDRSAWLLLGLLLTFSQSALAEYGVLGWGPSLVRFTAGYWLLMFLCWPAFMFLFGFYFPEPMPLFGRTDKPWRWLPAVVLVPYAVIVLIVEIAFVVGLTSYSSLAWLYRLHLPLHAVQAVYLYLLVSSFFFFIFSKSYREISPDSRRRLRLLAWGTSIAMTPALLLTIAVVLTGRTDFPDWLGTIVSVLFALFPLTLAYVIVVQRAMDVRVVVRQGLQYALAKNGMRVLQAAAILLVTLTAFALLQNRERTQKLIVIALGLAAIFVIRRLGEQTGAWIDRRFFREAYDAEQVLSELSDSVRTMVEVRSMIETVADCISRTLHISQVAVLLGGGTYRPAYALGYGELPDVAFPAGAGTVKLLEQQKEPARVYFDNPHSWLYREPEVSGDDRSKLTQLNAELLLPLSARDKLLGFISLGPKLSDEPYTRADLRLLKSVAAQTGLALENAQLISTIADEVAQRERLNSEVQIARDVQERLFPQTLPPIAGLQYAGACRTAFGVGGDYYDFLALPGGRLGVAIGDVSGKGIAAALTMASLQASLRSEATRAPEDLTSLMGNVNRLLHQALSSNRYATFFYGQYDPASRQLTYVNAGHNPPLLLRPCNGRYQISRLTASGTVVGLLEDAIYEQASLVVKPGDMLVAFTDGISEAMNADEEEWGEERLIYALSDCGGLPPTEIISCVMRAADAFVAGAKQHDDMTLVVLCAITTRLAVA